MQRFPGKRGILRHKVGAWERLRALGVKRIEYADALKNAQIQFGDRVRILSDAATDQLGFTGKLGTVCGQTIPSTSNVSVIGTLTDDYAVNVYFEESDEAHWFPERLLEFVDHGPGQTFSLDGSDKEWVRRADGSWEERSRE